MSSFYDGEDASKQQMNSTALEQDANDQSKENEQKGKEKHEKSINKRFLQNGSYRQLSQRSLE